MEYNGIKELIMDINTINECTNLSLAGKISFPEVVMKLASTGIERYIVDLVGFQKFTFGIQGEAHATRFTFKGPTIARKFDAAAVKRAIEEIQQKKINYQDFLTQIMLAGCCHYEVFILGKKVIYFGRDGSHHIELFPAISR